LRSQVSERTAQIEGVLREVVLSYRRDLEHSVDLDANNEALRNQFHYESWSDVQKTLDEMRAANHLDVAIALDPAGNIQAQSGADHNQAVAFAAARARSALAGGAGPVSLLEPIAGRFYFVAFKTVLFFGNPRGLLIHAKPLTDVLTTEIRKKVGAEITAFDATQLQASSLPRDSGYADRLKAVWSQLDPQSRVDLGSTSIAGKSYYVMAVPIAHEAKVLGGLAFALPEADIAVTQRRTLSGAAGLAALIIAAGAMLGLSFARRISRPIVAMAEQFGRIAFSGDLSLRVDDRLKNEIGDMARSFNAMQERVQELHQKVAQAEERMRKELQMASTVQEMLFQQVMPNNTSCEVAAYTSTLVETSGDWYAVFDDPKRYRTIFVIADATGHGAAAALLTAILHGFFQTLWTARLANGESSMMSPGEILKLLNQVVLQSARGAITATMFLGVFEHRSRRMIYANAGHLMPLVAKWKEGEPSVGLMTSSPSSTIGSIDEPKFDEREVQLSAGDLVLAYTDGLTEAENATHVQYGVRRLTRLLRNCQMSTVEHVRQTVLESVQSHIGSEPLKDDITYLTFRVR
jgi:serine phosphatase RsbU (regulator of sigma subunit)